MAAELADVRSRTLALVEPLTDETLHRRLDPFMSPLVWDLGHFAAHEDPWAVHELGGRPPLRDLVQEERS